MEADNKLLHMLTSSVTHEMVTPLKCMINFSEKVSDSMKSSKSPGKKEARLITTTAKLLLSQVQLLLDKNMLEYDLFTPNL